MRFGHGGFLAVVAVITAVVGVLMIPWLLRTVTNAMLFYPTRGQAATPDRFGIPYQERWLTSEDGVRIQAWWMPAEESSGSTVLSFHGNAGTLSDRLPWYRPVLRSGHSVLAVEYRGYGDSGGEPSEEGLARDARSGLALARQLARERGDKLILHGRSLGGAVALRLASDVADEEPALDGVLVESTFTSLSAMAGRSGIPFGSKLVAYQFASLERITESRVPLMLVHGEADELIPLSMGKALVEAARRSGREVRFLSVPGGTHNDTWIVGGDLYWSSSLKFIENPS